MLRRAVKRGVRACRLYLGVCACVSIAVAVSVSGCRRCFFRLCLYLFVILYLKICKETWEDTQK